MFRVLKLCWKALCFIRDLVMNVVFLGFVLLLVAIIGFSSGGKKSTALTSEGALLLNLDGYLADNRDETLRWQDALSELNGEHVPRKISTFDVVFAIKQAEDDPKIKGLGMVVHACNSNSLGGQDGRISKYSLNSVPRFSSSSHNKIFNLSSIIYNF